MTIEGFRGIAEPLDLSLGSKNLLLHGENGAAKTSIARALELLLDPTPDRDLLNHKNIFGSADPTISASFKGRYPQTDPKTKDTFEKLSTTTLSWNPNNDKPLPQWILEGGRRSAFLSYRRLLLLSDQTRDLSENFFRAAVTSLFPHLLVGTSGKTIGELWSEASDAAAAYRSAKFDTAQKSSTGVSKPTPHHKTVEDAVTLLNQALGDYLLPRGGQPSQLVEESNRLMIYFGDSNLKIELDFSGLSFNRKNGLIEGCEIVPEISFCEKSLNVSSLNLETGSDISVAKHHLFLNESRLTSLGLALFLAALKIADITSYIPGSTDPTEPLRLLVLDDVLVGLDYDHRVPVLELLVEEFPAHQILLFTHDRTWFDIASLDLAAVSNSRWKTERIFSLRGRGLGGSDLPIIDDVPLSWLERAKWFLDERKEFPAAANYTRTAVEHLLKSIAHRKRVKMPFTREPHKLNTEDFLCAIEKITAKPKGKILLIPKKLQNKIRALRKTVLNPLSHAHPNTITEIEVRKAIEVGEWLSKIEKKLPKRS